MARNAQALRTGHLHADLGQRTARGGLTAILAQLTRIGVQLISMSILARLLAPRDFGLVAMATTLTSFIGLFTGFGLSAATVQRKEIDQATASAIFYINLATGLGLLLVCVAVAPLAGWFFGDPRVVLVTIALGLSIPVLAAGAQHSALLQRGMRWASLQWTPVFAQGVGCALAILLAWKADFGYWALVVQLLATALVATALFWQFCPWRPNLIPRWRDAGTALHFGIHLTGFNLVNYFHRQFDNVLVGSRWGAVDLGYYTRAYQLLLLPLTIVNFPVSSAVVPALSRLQADPSRWRVAFLRILGGVSLLTSALSAMLIASAEPLVRLVYGAQWDEAGHLFLLLSISTFSATVFNAAGWAYISLGQTKRLLQWGLYVTPFFVAAFALGLPFGPQGVALCYSIAMCLAALPCLAFVTRDAPVGFWDCVAVWLPPAIAGGLAAWGARTLGGAWVQHGTATAVLEKSSLAIVLYGIIVAALGLIRLHSLSPSSASRPGALFDIVSSLNRHQLGDHAVTGRAGALWRRMRL